MGYDGPPSCDEFFLLASFSRSRFRLSEENVGVYLQSILGGNPSSFAVSTLVDRVFRFSVSRKAIGLEILRLGLFACLVFKVAFFFCNDHGFSEAASFSKSDSGPSFDWVEVRSKKSPSKPSFAHIVKRSTPPLSGANATPLGSSSGNWHDPLHGPRDFSKMANARGTIFPKKASSRGPVFSRFSSPQDSAGLSQAGSEVRFSTESSFLIDQFSIV